MKIIDAHLHFCDEPYFDQIAEAAGHKNTSEHL
ncbi:MAG: amidohydrolase, partial [Sporomusaceae bacterium]|nr:amidohydrolase [Sporomusaceae bacterium]